MSDAQIALAVEKAAGLPVSWTVRGDEIIVVAWEDTRLIELGVVESRTVAQECVKRIEAARKTD